MRRVSGLILMILKSYSLPGSRGPALFKGPVVVRCMDAPSSRRRLSSISVLWQSASMFSPSSTKAPKVAILRVDLQYLGGDRLALAEDFVRILHAPGPTDVADVHEAVKAVLDLHEGTELRDIAHFPGDHRTDRILFRNLQPRIRQGLLHAQGNTAVAGLRS